MQSKSFGQADVFRASAPWKPAIRIMYAKGTRFARIRRSLLSIGMRQLAGAKVAI